MIKVILFRNAEDISGRIADTLNANRSEGEKVEVFAYSIFYVFYEQYLTLVCASFIFFCETKLSGGSKEAFASCLKMGTKYPSQGWSSKSNSRS